MSRFMLYPFLFIFFIIFLTMTAASQEIQYPWQEDFEDNDASNWIIVNSPGETRVSIDSVCSYRCDHVLRIDVSFYDPSAKDGVNIHYNFPVSEWMPIAWNDSVIFRWDWKVSDIWETNFVGLCLMLCSKQDEELYLSFDRLPCTLYTYSYECFIPTPPGRWASVSIPVSEDLKKRLADRPELISSMVPKYLELKVGGTKIEHLWLNNLYLGPKKECPFEDIPPPPLSLIDIPFDQNSRFHPHAGALEDADGDADLDLYLATHLHQNPLLINNGKGRFVKIVTQGVGDRGVANSAVFVDLDDDGDQDILLANQYQASPNQLFENEGFGHFNNATADWGFNCGTINWSGFLIADLNIDGQLDAICYHSFSPNSHFEFEVFQNIGKRELIKINDQLSEHNGILGFGNSHPIMADFDLDSDPDLFSPQLKYYRNEGNFHFVQDTTILNFLGTLPITGCPFTTCHTADVDIDGDLDLFLAYIPWTHRDTVYYRDWNLLLLNDGKGYFRDATIEAGLAVTYKTVASHIADFDNDGDIDIYLANNDGENAYYRNDGHGHFRNEIVGSDFEDARDANGLVVGDIDNDGDLDLILIDYLNNYRIKWNPTNNKNFLKIWLTGTRSNRDTIGAKVRIYETGHLGNPKYLKGYQEVIASGVRRSTSTKQLHFGLGKLKAVDIEVLFPSGLREMRYAVKPGRTIRIVETPNVFHRKVVAPVFLIYRPYLQGILFNFSAVGRWLVPVLLGLLIAILIYFRQKSIIFIFISSLLILVLIYLYWGFHPIRGIPYLITGAISYGGFTLGVTFIQKRRISGRLAREALFLELVKFEHQRFSEGQLDRLNIFLNNLTNPEMNASIEIIERIENLTQQISHHTLPVMERIEDLVKAAHVSCPNGKLSTQVLCLKKNLEKITQTLHKRESTSSLAHCALQQIQQLQTKLQNLKKTIAPDFTANLIETVNQVIQALESQITEVGVTVSGPANLPAETYIRFPEWELPFILENLFQNSIRVLCDQPVRKIMWNVRKEAVRIIFDLKDTGPGIPEENREKIFEANFTTKQDNTDGGFGLYESRELINRYGGAIYVAESEIGKGTTMRIEFRISRQEN